MSSEFLYGEGRPVRQHTLSNGDILAIDEEFIKMHGEAFAIAEIDNAEQSIAKGTWPNG